MEERDCLHKNAGFCTICNRCKSCHYDECMGEHSTKRGKLGKAVRDHRIEHWRKTNAQATNNKQVRDSSLAIATFNEDELEKPVVETIGKLEEMQREAQQFPCYDYPVRDVSERLGLQTMSKRNLNRASSFSSSSLDNLTVQRDAVTVVGQFLDRILCLICDSDEARTKLRNLHYAHLNPSMDEPSLVVKNVVDAFVRESDPDQERRYFALLLGAYNASRNQLGNIIHDGAHRALADPNFMERAKSKFYSKRLNVEGVNDDLSDEDLEEDSSIINHNPKLKKSKSSSIEKVEIPAQKLLSRKARWVFSQIRLARADDDFQTIHRGEPLPHIWNAARVSTGSLQATLRFLENISLGWKGGATRSSKIGNGCELKAVPILNISMNKNEAWKEYQEASLKTPEKILCGSKVVGYDTFSSLYDSMTKLIEEKHALSYYYTGALDAITTLTSTVERLEKLWKENHDPQSEGSVMSEMSQLPFNFEQIKMALKQCLCHLKYGLRSHLVTRGDCGGDALHCCRFAVGAACDRAVHTIGDCAECINFCKLPDCTRSLLNAVANCLAREHDGDAQFLSTTVGAPVHEALTMASPISYCYRTLNLYHKHVMRGAWQNQEVEETVNNLEVGEVLVTLDHKQKIEPVNFNESSEEYYGKKGISLLGFVLRWRDGAAPSPVKTHFIDAVSCNSKQDASQVQTILSRIIPTIKDIVPLVKRLILLSDNGPSFTSKDNMQFISHRNRSKWECNVEIVRWIYFEAQCGKTILDCHFSFVGIFIRRFARKVRAVKVPEDVYEALIHGGGIANTSTHLVRFALNEDTADSEMKVEVAIDNIRKIHDIRFENDKVITFNFSGVQQGKHVYDFAKYVPSIKDAMLALSSKSQKTAHVKDVEIQPEIPNGPSIIFRSAARPHETRVSEAVIAFATESREIEPSILMNFALPIMNENHAATSTSSKSKQKVKPLDNEEFRASYESGWAEAQQRKTPQMSSQMEEILRKMVSCKNKPYRLY